MEVAIGMVGAAITVLGVVFAYIWRANGKVQKALLEGQRTMMEALTRIEESLVKIEEGQRQGFKYLADLLVQESRLTRDLIIQERRRRK